MEARTKARGRPGRRLREGLVEAPTGPSNVSLDEVLAFDGVRETVQAISSELLKAWRVVRPEEASVEFALTLKAKEGKLTGLLVSGGAEGSLKVTLTWKNSDTGSANGQGGSTPVA